MKIEPSVSGRNLIGPNGEVKGRSADRSIVDYLRCREAGSIRPNTQTLALNSLYPAMAPSTSILCDKVPFACAKRFSPCGKVAQEATAPLIRSSG